MSRPLRVILAFIVLGCVQLAGCVVYQPVPVAGPPNFDRAWNGAPGGAQDAGVQVTSSDPSTGLIRGTKDGVDVTVVVARQADGSVRVQFDAKGPTQRDPEAQQPFLAGVRPAHGPLNLLVAMAAAGFHCRWPSPWQLAQY